MSVRRSSLDAQALPRMTTRFRPGFPSILRLPAPASSCRSLALATSTVAFRSAEYLQSSERWAYADVAVAAVSATVMMRRIGDLHWVCAVRLDRPISDKVGVVARRPYDGGMLGGFAF